MNEFFQVMQARDEALLSNQREPRLGETESRH